MNKYFLAFAKKMTDVAPLYCDAIFMTLFTILITFRPYYLVGQINVFELGIYLPGIDAILDGRIPYRDFFHLRGPLELYVPAFFMNLFGKNISILATYFYVGTVATLCIYVLIAKEIYKTKLAFYLLIPVLIGRTFPRAVFHIWGGMRFGLGALAILFLIYFLQKRKFFWIFLAGIISSLAFLTSAEIGICSILAAGTMFILSFYFKFDDYAFIWKSIYIYLAGLAAVLFPYGLFLVATQSAVPFFDCIYSVATNMTKTFPDYLFEPHPKNFIEALFAMNPFNPHFKHLTPAYCYLFFVSYVIVRLKKISLKRTDLPVALLFTYGFIMYVLAFRKIGAGQFEMALQPEKLLLFLMLERTFLFLRKKKKDLKCLYFDKISSKGSKKVLFQVYGINFLFILFIFSSLGYSIQRYNLRFPAFKYVRNLILGKDVSAIDPLNKQEKKTLTIERVEGMTVPIKQAYDFEQISEFVSRNTDEDETVFMFPEYAAYSFVVDRPFVGRFPMVTFSWINNHWADELFLDLKKSKPVYAILPQKLDLTFEKVYFKIKRNKDSFDEVMEYIDKNYKIIKTTDSAYIYKRI